MEDVVCLYLYYVQYTVRITWSQQQRWNAVLFQLKYCNISYGVLSFIYSGFVLLFPQLYSLFL